MNLGISGNLSLLPPPPPTPSLLSPGSDGLRRLRGASPSSPSSGPRPPTYSALRTASTSSRRAASPGWRSPKAAMSLTMLPPPCSPLLPAQTSQGSPGSTSGGCPRLTPSKKRPTCQGGPPPARGTSTRPRRAPSLAAASLLKVTRSGAEPPPTAKLPAPVAPSGTSPHTETSPPRAPSRARSRAAASRAPAGSPQASASRGGPRPPAPALAPPAVCSHSSTSDGISRRQLTSSVRPAPQNCPARLTLPPPGGG